LLGIDSTTSLGDTQSAITEVPRANRKASSAALERQSRIETLDKQALQDQVVAMERELAQVTSHGRFYFGS
jgi:hypothetical protein